MRARRTHATPTLRVPKLCRHATGQAYARHKGQSYYFGVYGTAEAERQYRVWAAQIVAGAPVRAADAPAVTFAELAEQYLAHARSRYQERHVLKVAGVVNLCLPIYGETFARDFGPAKLRTVRELLVRCNYHPNTINQRLTLLRKMFRWGVGWELIPAGVGYALREVEGLKAPPPEPKPADERAIDAALPMMPAAVADMCRVQLLTGMRPGEVVAINGGEIRRDDPAAGIWCYRPALHKCAHHGLRREVLIGPRAQLIVGAYLAASPAGPIFRPADALPWKPKRGRAQPIGERYTVQSYGKAVVRACHLACVPEWTPGQLRHNAATRLEAEFGPDIARIILGHTSLATTRRYVKVDLARAADALRRVG